MDPFAHSVNIYWVFYGSGTVLGMREEAVVRQMEFLPSENNILIGKLDQQPQNIAMCEKWDNI